MDRWNETGLLTVVERLESVVVALTATPQERETASTLQIEVELVQAVRTASGLGLLTALFCRRQTFAIVRNIDTNITQ